MDQLVSCCNIDSYASSCISGSATKFGSKGIHLEPCVRGQSVRVRDYGGMETGRFMGSLGRELVP